MPDAVADHPSKSFVVVHPLDPEDAAFMTALRAMTRGAKGASRPTEEAREQFDALMESVPPRGDVTVEAGALGGVPGFWLYSATWRSDAAILHLHGGWFNLGSARTYRHLVGQIAARAKARAFVPDYRLAPEHAFPAAADDALTCYRALAASEVNRIVLCGDSAGGALALGLASQVAGGRIADRATLAGVGLLSPVTDLTLSGRSYQTRADVDPFFTRPQVAELVGAYLAGADEAQPLASPLNAALDGMPPVRIHVGDDEVLLDDSLRFAERGLAAGVDARVDVWMGMAHGFPVNLGRLKAAALALDAVGAFIAERL